MDSITLLKTLIEKRLILVQNIVKNKVCFSELTNEYFNSKILVIFTTNNKNILFRLMTNEKGNKHQINELYEDLERLEFDLTKLGIYQYQIEFVNE